VYEVKTRLQINFACKFNLYRYIEMREAIVYFSQALEMAHENYDHDHDESGSGKNNSGKKTTKTSPTSPTSPASTTLSHTSSLGGAVKDESS
jgi:hypothetical protein